MTEFKPITIEDKDTITAFTQSCGFRSADYSFTNMVMWGHMSSPQYTVYEGRLIVRLGGRQPRYLFPIGSGPLEKAIAFMEADAAALGQDKLSMRVVPVPAREALEAAFPGRFSFEPMRNSFDYIYTGDQLANLAGKKLHGKRNHINRFLQENTWSFQPVTSENLHLCRELTEKWMAQNTELKHEDYSAEQTALQIAFDNFDAFGLEGGILWAGGQVVAFTIGEILGPDAYIVHFEKAFSQINGAYPMINREFVRYILSIHPEIVYFNREEDMGHENLRKAKESYFPEFMVEKFMVTER